MIIDTKPRDFSYIYHRNNQPLEITGTMKHRPRPQSSNPHIKNQSITFGNQKPSISQQQILNNYKDLKSIIPVDLKVQKRRQSIKTYEKQKNVQVSGAALLMMKSRVSIDHPQKRHLTQRYSLFTDGDDHHKQKRHYRHENKQSESKQKSAPRKHENTLNQKLMNDIYSRIEVKENIVNNTFKMSQNTLFKQGVELGFEHDREPRISAAKRRQLQGSASKPQNKYNRVFRNDWRNNSFQLDW